MREKKKFGKRTDTKRLPNDDAIKETFGIVNSGCDSKQVANFIERTTGHKNQHRRKITMKNINDMLIYNHRERGGNPLRVAHVSDIRPPS